MDGSHEGCEEGSELYKFINIVKVISKFSYFSMNIFKKYLG